MPFTARADMAIGKFIKIQIRKKLFKLNIKPTFNKLKLLHIFYILLSFVGIHTTTIVNPNEPVELLFAYLSRP